MQSKVKLNGARGANVSAHSLTFTNGATIALDGTPTGTAKPTAKGAPETTDGNLAAAVWRIGAPKEWAYFAHLCHSIEAATGETLDRLRVSDWKHATSALIYKSAASLRGRGESLDADTLASECQRCADECDRISEVSAWENARDACEALNTSQAPNGKGNPDKLAVELAAQIAPPQRFKFSTLGEVMTRPDPEFLIERVLVAGATSLLTAKHASFKSFIALDMALCVATGKPWHGFKVKRGAVVYIAAEGAAGIKKRARAWLDYHDEATPENFLVLDVPVQIADEATRAAFIAEVLALEPALIILDTLARCAVGLEENSSKDMGNFADALGKLAHATGAHILTVHHNNKGGDYRGSSAVPAAVDTHLSLERKGDTVTLEILKQKDAEEIGPLFFEKKDVSIAGTQGQAHSIVFERLETRDTGAGGFNDVEQKAFDALFECYGSESVSTSQWKRAASHEKDLPESSFSKARQGLVERKGAVLLVAGEKGGRGASAAMYQIAPSWLPTEESDGAARSTLYGRSTDESAEESNADGSAESAARSTLYDHSTDALRDVSPDIERESGDLERDLTPRSTLYGHSTDESAPESEAQSTENALRSTVPLFDASPDIERESSDFSPILPARSTLYARSTESVEHKPKPHALHSTPPLGGESVERRVKDKVESKPKKGKESRKSGDATGAAAALDGQSHAPANRADEVRI